MTLPQLSSVCHEITEEASKVLVHCHLRVRTRTATPTPPKPSADLMFRLGDFPNGECLNLSINSPPLPDFLLAALLAPRRLHEWRPQVSGGSGLLYFRGTPRCSTAQSPHSDITGHISWGGRIHHNSHGDSPSPLRRGRYERAAADGINKREFHLDFIAPLHKLRHHRRISTLPLYLDPGTCLEHGDSASRLRRASIEHAAGDGRILEKLPTHVWTIWYTPPIDAAGPTQAAEKMRE
ncbi:hypothetical protein C8J57DRAFT_1730046 [Mycena rebaudengoi]|nr:hypothetical protein C8J57DRAFT_1730046 [Mycena rebaudengoi]